MRNRDALTRVILHRVRTHRAALANAQALGYPPDLVAQVVETQARLDECLTLGAELLGIDALADDLDGDEYTPAMGHGVWWVGMTDAPD